MACFRRCRRQTTTTVRNFNQNNFIPSSVEVSYSLTQTVNPGEEVSFAQTNYNTGISFSPRADNLGIDIVAAGVYKITFTGNITTLENGNISLGISLNGTLIPQSEILQYVTTAGSETVISTIVFKVISPSADIGVVNNGNLSFNVSNAKLDIVRNGNF